MKTFVDLHLLDYIYILDRESGIVDRIKIVDKVYSISNTVIFTFSNIGQLWFAQDKSITVDRNLVYIADQSLLIPELEKLIKHYKVVIKSATKNIKLLKEI